MSFVRLSQQQQQFSYSSLLGGFSSHIVQQSPSNGICSHGFISLYPRQSMKSHTLYGARNVFVLSALCQIPSGSIRSTSKRYSSFFVSLPSETCVARARVHKSSLFTTAHSFPGFVSSFIAYCL